MLRRNSAIDLLLIDLTLANCNQINLYPFIDFLKHRAILSTGVIACVTFHCIYNIQDTLLLSTNKAEPKRRKFRERANIFCVSKFVIQRLKILTRIKKLFLLSSFLRCRSRRRETRSIWANIKTLKNILTCPTTTHFSFNSPRKAR